MPIPVPVSRIAEVKYETVLDEIRGQLARRHMTQQALGRLADRHRCATRGYRGTKDLFAVQQVLGHRSASTTQLYVALDVDALASVIEAAA